MNNIFEKNEKNEKNEIEDDDEDEVFELENLIQYLNKNNFNILSAFMYENRIVFLFIVNINNGNELMLYIPSSHTIQIKDKTKNINIYKLIEIEEESEENKKNNIFSNEKEDKNKLMEERLERFIPVFEDESFKLCYIKDKNILFINRHNSIDKFNLNVSSQHSEFYILTDLEYFSSNCENINKEFNNFEKRMNDKITNPVNNIIKEYSNIMKTVENDIKKATNLNLLINKYNERRDKLDILSDKMLTSKKDTTKQKEELFHMKSELRKEHLNYIFNLENICYSIKKLKDTI